MRIPVIGFAAWSGTGKTTLIERLIPVLVHRGVRVGVIKHDGHHFEIDQPGKDTRRHREAGASAVMITSPDQTALMMSKPMKLEDCVAQISGVDLILVEGFKHADIPQIGLSNTAAGKPYTAPPERFIAVVTDGERPAAGIPCFGFEETEALAEFILEAMKRMSSSDFTHFNDQGRARMVDVGDKAETHRTATAAGRVRVNRNTFELIRTGGMKKGDVLTVAQIAGIMAAKHTPDWIPMCHPVSLSGVDLRLWLEEERLSVEIEASVRCDGRTGVEMEALTAVSGAALTVYDMCKAVQRDMVIEEIRLVSKTGGIHGDYHREDENR